MKKLGAFVVVLVFLCMLFYLGRQGDFLSDAARVGSHNVACPHCRKTMSVRDDQRVLPRHKDNVGRSCPRAENPNYPNWRTEADSRRKPFRW